MTFSGVTTCKPLPPVVLQKETRPSCSSRLAHFLGGGDDGREGNVGGRVQVEHKAPGKRWMVRLAIPGMELHGRDLRHGDEALDAIDLQVGLAIAFDRGELDQIGNAGHGVTLEELLAVDAVRRADDGAGPPLEMLDHPGTDLFEIGGQISLGDGASPFSAGQSALSGLEMVTPMTTVAPALARSLALGTGRGRRQLSVLGRDGMLGSHFLGGLVFAKPFEGGLADHAAPVQPANSISATSTGFTQVQSRCLRGASLPAKGLLSVGVRLELPEQVLGIARVEAGADLADMDEMVAAIHAGDQRAQVGCAAAPAADHHLMAGAAFGFGPGLGAARAVAAR